MSDIQAAIGIHQLKKIDDFQKSREKYVNMYNEGLSDVSEIITPFQAKNVKHAWHLYVIQLNLDLMDITRNEFIQELFLNKIGSSVHFIPLHLHPFYKKKLDFNGRLLNSEYLYERVISLPLYPAMSVKDVQDVIRSIRRIIRNHRKNIKGA